MAKPELEFQDTSAQPWQPVSGAVPGIWERILSRDPQSGDYTRLMKFDPGVDSSSNGVLVHDHWEEIYILQGSFTDLRLGQTFHAGDYACRPPGMPHGPWRSDEGIVMIEVRYGFPAPGA